MTDAADHSGKAVSRGSRRDGQGLAAVPETGSIAASDGSETEREKLSVMTMSKTFTEAHSARAK